MSTRASRPLLLWSLAILFACADVATAQLQRLQEQVEKTKEQVERRGGHRKKQGDEDKPPSNSKSKPTSKPATTPKKGRDNFAVGAKVQAKQASTWKPALIKVRDRDLYLVVYDDEKERAAWEWVHVGIVRKVGSDKEWPEPGAGVRVGDSTVPKAKEQAVKDLANLQGKLAEVEEAERERVKAKEASAKASPRAAAATRPATAPTRPPAPPPTGPTPSGTAGDGLE
jgi:hypothetical protein